MDLHEETIATKNIFDGRIIKVRVDDVQLPNGKKSKREVVEHAGGVTVIPITSEGEIILVEQFRKPIEDTLLELPAGKLEEGEEPLDCAKRELVEETGYKAGKIKYMFSFFTSPGFSNEVLHLYLAEDLEPVGIDPDPDEILRIVRIKKNVIKDYINSGKIRDAKTVIGLLSIL